MKTVHGQRTVLAALILLATVAPSGAATTGAAQINAGFAYKLSDFTGFIPYTTPRLVVDDYRDEVYVLFQNLVRVFNEYGMEVYRFGDDLGVGQIVDLVVNREGDIILLCYDQGRYRLLRCNYRGEPVAEFRIRDLPDRFAVFEPTRFRYLDGRLYFASLTGFRVVVTDESGRYQDGYDLAELLELTEKEVAENEMIGFSVAPDRSILFTIPTFFKVYRVSPDRQVSSFGEAGGPPGKFGVIAGVAVDRHGNYLITDKLKSIVHIFSRDASYVAEFGYRGIAPGSLFSPEEVALSSRDRVFVSQARNMGVSVFVLTYGRSQ